MMNKLDANNNGVIDYTEFIAGCMESKLYLKEEHLKNAFQYFDKVSIVYGCVRVLICRITVALLRRMS